MEVRSNTEIGLKHVGAFFSAQEKKVENPAHIPGSDYSNRQLENSERDARALRMEQTKTHYKVAGPSINVLT